MKRRVESDAEEEGQDGERAGPITSDQEATGEEENMDYEENDGERIDYSDDEDEEEVDDDEDNDDEEAVEITKVRIRSMRSLFTDI
jgi:hypothetical protein